MNAIALIFSKFSDELLAAQLSFLCLTAAVALYLLVLRKKKQQTAEWVPAALVKAYLDRVDADERDIRWKLFGEHSVASFTPSVSAPLATALGTAPGTGTVTTIIDPNTAREVEALRAQLHMADQRTMEFDRLLNTLKAEKALLEQKLAAIPATGGAASAVSAQIVQELEEVKAKLSEYAVIEDDLANLKKFQKENELLKAKVKQYEGGATVNTVVSGSPQAPEVKTVISGATARIEAPAMTVISGGGATTPVAAAPVLSAAPAPAPAPQAEMNTNVLQAITPSFDDTPPAAAAAPAPAASAEPEKSSKQKEDDLLSEFEKMLAS